MLKSNEIKMLDYIKSARSEMEQAACLCDELTDFAAIDYAAYNLLAAKKKYAYLIQLAKEEGIRL